MSRILFGTIALAVFVTGDCRNLLNRALSMSDVHQAQSMSDALYQSRAQDQEYGIGLTLLMVSISAVLAYGITSWFSQATAIATVASGQDPNQRSETSSLVPKNESSSSSSSSQGDPSPWTPFYVMLISIPALVGSCCWPLLIAVIVGIHDIAAAKYREAAHSITFGFHLGIFAVLLPQLFSRTLQQRSQMGYFMKWSPFALAGTGALLVMVDLTRHMMLDQGFFEGVFDMYDDNGHLTFVGKIGVACTWLGVIALVIGTSWLTSFSSRLQKFFSSTSNEQAAS